MLSRGSIIAGLVVVELAIVGEAVVAVGGQPDPASDWLSGGRPIAGRLIEGGPHQQFMAGLRPKVTVDIGYADLTILTRRGAHIDVAASTGSRFGPLHATGPIAAVADGDVVRVSAPHGGGDDRMVTLTVPAETRITVLAAGDIRAEGLRAEATFTALGGGTVTVEDFDAPALHVTAARGTITLHRVVAPRLDAATRRGHIDASGLVVRNGQIQTGDGATLEFGAGTDALITAEAGDGDTVHAVGFAAPAPSADGQTRGQTVRAGAGDGRIYVRATDGDITLAQSGN